MHARSSPHPRLRCRRRQSGGDPARSVTNALWQRCWRAAAETKRIGFTDYWATISRDNLHAVSWTLLDLLTPRYAASDTGHRRTAAPSFRPPVVLRVIDLMWCADEDDWRNWRRPPSTVLDRDRVVVFVRRCQPPRGAVDTGPSCVSPRTCRATRSRNTETPFTNNGAGCKLKKTWIVERYRQFKDDVTVR